MTGVIIGVDPHKLSATIEVVDHHGHLLGSGRFPTDRAGYTAMRGYVKAWPQRIWAVEGANGAGRPLAQRLVATGERVVDVPAKLAARVRLFDTGHNRKTDALDAHSIAMVALRTAGLRELTADGQLEALRMLADRRDELAHRRVQTVNRLQRLLSELVPGQRKRDLSALQAKAILGSVRPRDLAGKTRRRMAVEELADLVVVDAKLKKIKAELRAAVIARGSGLMEHHRRRPGRIRPDPGRCRRRRQVRRPEPVRLLDRDRAAGRVLRRAHPPPPVPGREPADEPRAAHRGHRPAASRHPGPGVLPEEARRWQDPDGSAALPQTTSVRRRVPTPRCRRRRNRNGPGGHCGATLTSSAVDLHPHIDTSDQPLPGPATPTLRPTQRARKTAITTADPTCPLTQRGARSGQPTATGASKVRWCDEA